MNRDTRAAIVRFRREAQSEVIAAMKRGELRIPDVCAKAGISNSTWRRFMGVDDFTRIKARTVLRILHACGLSVELVERKS